MELNIQNMPDNELVSLRDKLNNEIEIRKRQQQDVAWQAVQVAIAAYIEKFGSINVNNDNHIDGHYDLSTPGEIFPIYW